MAGKVSIEVRAISQSDPLEFDVRLGESSGQTRHRVALSMADRDRLCGGTDPCRLIDAAFRFLLDREPKESILRRFDLAVIGRYFPEFESQLPTYLRALAVPDAADLSRAERG